MISANNNLLTDADYNDMAESEKEARPGIW